MSDDDEDILRRGRRRRQADEEQEHSCMTLTVATAAYYGDVDMIMGLLREGADIEEEDPKDHWRPLHAAIMSESEEAAQYLLRQRAQVNAIGPYGMTPLHLACRDNSEDMVRLLLARGADVEALDGEGRTPAALCIEQGSHAARLILEGASAEPEAEAAAAAAAVPAAATEVSPATDTFPMFSSTPMMLLPREAPAESPASALAVAAAATEVGVAAAELPNQPWFGSAVDPAGAEEFDQAQAEAAQRMEEAARDGRNYGWNA
mmetsp:Transcript_102164/g.218764  ORF Transcript_102164/g.218764 Transcript_102164/m.218764 type:complete len:262 (+) Transcript_102164:68-853(+)